MVLVQIARQFVILVHCRSSSALSESVYMHGLVCGVLGVQEECSGYIRQRCVACRLGFSGRVIAGQYILQSEIGQLIIWFYLLIIPTEQ